MGGEGPGSIDSAPMPRHLLRAALLLVAQVSAGSAAEAAELFPDVAVHLEASRYVPADREQQWTGWIGAGAGLLRLEGTTLYFTADVETILGHRIRPFEATQADYHLEVGLRRTVGPYRAALVFHHVSRHLVDTAKVQAVDWNLVGVRASRTFGRLTASAGLARAIQESLVAYGWEATGAVDAEVLRRRWGGAYAGGGFRAVSAEASPALPRSGFLDARLEGGVRLPRAGGHLELFVAWERRNDVFLETPGRRDRRLAGFRLGRGDHHREVGAAVPGALRP